MYRLRILFLKSKKNLRLKITKNLIKYRKVELRNPFDLEIERTYIFIGKQGTGPITNGGY